MAEPFSVSLAQPLHNGTTLKPILVVDAFNIQFCKFSEFFSRIFVQFIWDLYFVQLLLLPVGQLAIILIEGLTTCREPASKIDEIVVPRQRRPCLASLIQLPEWIAL